MKLALGIDPDTADTAFAWWDELGPLHVRVAHVIRRPGGIDLMQTALAVTRITSIPGVTVAAIEGQQIDKRRARPQDLFKLAHTTGIAIAFVADRYLGARLVVPTPKEWKGSVAKHAMQGRLYLELGWGSTVIGSGTSKYARPINVPPNFAHISPGQWKHVGDALLLAKYAYEL